MQKAHKNIINSTIQEVH